MTALSVRITFVLAASLAPVLTSSGQIILDASKAALKGERLVLDPASSTVTGLLHPSDSLAWSFTVPTPGWYQIVVHYSVNNPQNLGKVAFKANLGHQTRLGPIHPTGSGQRFLPQVLVDPVELARGNHRLDLHLKDSTGPTDLKIRRVELIRAPEPGVP